MLLASLKSGTTADQQWTRLTCIYPGFPMIATQPLDLFNQLCKATSNAASSSHPASVASNLDIRPWDGVAGRWKQTNVLEGGETQMKRCNKEMYLFAFYPSSFQTCLENESGAKLGSHQVSHLCPSEKPHPCQLSILRVSHTSTTYFNFQLEEPLPWDFRFL